MKALVIENKKALTDSLKKFLISQNYDIDIATCEIEAQELAKSGIYDLVIIDGSLEYKNVSDDTLSYGNTCLNLSSGTLVHDDKMVRLTAKELDIIRLLFKNPNYNISKNRIISHVWGYDSYAIDNNVEVYIGFLRKKLATIDSNVSIVATRKLGYHLEIRKDSV